MIICCDGEDAILCFDTKLFSLVKHITVTNTTRISFAFLFSLHLILKKNTNLTERSQTLVNPMQESAK